MNYSKRVTLAEMKMMEKELADLKRYLRTDVIKRVHDAIQLGDLANNPEYDAAREEQLAVILEIERLKDQLNNLAVIDSTDPEDKE